MAEVRRVGHEPLHRFLDGIERCVSGAIVEEALGFGNAAIRTVGNVIPGGAALFFGDGGSPLFPGGKSQAGGLAKPGGHRFGVAAECESRGGDNVKTLAHAVAPIRDRLQEALRHVGGVDVMEGFKTQVRQAQLLATSKLGEYRRIGVPCGVHRNPAGADDVAGMEHGRGEAVLTGLGKEIGFDGGLVAAVFSEGMTRLGLGGRHLNAMAVNPDGTAVQEMLHPAAQRLDQLLGAGLGETDHVDDHVGRQVGDLPAKRAVLLGRGAIELHLPHGLPGGMNVVGGSPLSADADHLVAGFHQLGRQIGADMSCTADDDYSHKSPRQGATDLSDNLVSDGRLSTVRRNCSSNLRADPITRATGGAVRYCRRPGRF